MLLNQDERTLSVQVPARPARTAGWQEGRDGE
jgi:hypothetical protein